MRTGWLVAEENVRAHPPSVYAWPIHMSTQVVPSIQSRLPSSDPRVNVYVPAFRDSVLPDRNPTSLFRRPATVPRPQLSSNCSRDWSGASASLFTRPESHQTRSQEDDGYDGGRDGQGDAGMTTVSE